MVLSLPRTRAGRIALGAGLAGLAFLAASALQAGGTIDWAGPIDEFAQAGVGAGQAAVTLVIVILGFLIGFSLPGLIPLVAPAALMAVVVANADSISSIFGGGGGGGSFLDTAYVAAAGVQAAMPHLLLLSH